MNLFLEKNAILGNINLITKKTYQNYFIQTMLLQILSLLLVIHIYSHYFLILSSLKNLLD